MSKLSKTPQKPTHDEIAACAQHIYENEGRPQGKAMEHWLRAENQLSAQRKAESQSSAPWAANQASSSLNGGKSAPVGSNWESGLRKSLQKH